MARQHQPPNFYANPAFSQQSEYCGRVPPRRSPVGAQTPRRYDEQEFYEELLVDGHGTVREKKLVVVATPPHSADRECIPMRAYAAAAHRYEYIDGDGSPPPPPPPPSRRTNPVATRRLYELLATPPKPHVVSARRNVFAVRPKAQQRLEYVEAVPMSPRRRQPVAPLAVAAFMMTVCGAVTSSLCFYMISVMGKVYYLDFGTAAGFACLVLGLFGYWTRNCDWLPNRNYISGYIVLSVFSLLTSAGLLILLLMQPRPGTPLADITSVAVCGLSVLSLVLAFAGVVASYCCKYPPPDNRVEHSVQGFSV